MTNIQEGKNVRPELDTMGTYEFGWSDSDDAGDKAERGINPRIVTNISTVKQEPEWMLNNRLKAFKLFNIKPMPTWGADLSTLDFDNIKYFVKSTEKQAQTWEDLPEDIKNTYERLGIPEAERQRLVSGIAAQYESEVVYHQINKDLEAQGVLFLDTDTALKEYPEIFEEYFGTVIPAGDNKFAALNTAVWSGGSFVYVPKGIHVEIPLQAYFRINTENMGQFERTLIIADEGSYVHYVEGCLLAGEEIALADGSVKYVEDIKKGDKVRDHTGKESKVEDLIRRPFSGITYTFKPISTGNTFTTTGEHPILIVPRSKVLTKRKLRGEHQPEVNTKLLLQATPEWIKAEEIHAGDFLVFPKNQRIKPAVELPLNLGKLAGYYLAEGSAQLNNKSFKALTFSFHMNELEYVKEVQDLCEELYGTRGSVYVLPEKNSATVTIYTKKGYDFMKEHIGSRSWTKKLSPLLFNQNNDFIKALIDGYMNGDGNLLITNGTETYRAGTTSRDWAFQLQTLMTRQNIFATVRLERVAGPAIIMNRKVTRHDMYKVHWTGSRTMGEVRYADNHFLVPIKKITEQLFEGPVYNFETQPANSYLAKGFAVHNCTAPIYSSDSLHSAVVEIIVKKDARVRYTTIQNWSTNVYNLVTKRATVAEGGTMEWVDGNIGSKVTMKYPSIYLMGKHAKGETLSVAFAGEGQHQDAGAKMVHMAPYTQSSIVSKSIARNGGRTSYRGEVKIDKTAHHSSNSVICDALLIDSISRSDTYPAINIQIDDVQLGHEATVSKVSQEQLFYLMSRGMPETEAMAMIARGFIEPIAKELPMEYALELNKLIEMGMEGSVG
jgi:Fe-S cluster assembly protein SufB